MFVYLFIFFFFLLVVIYNILKFLDIFMKMNELMNLIAL